MERTEDDADAFQGRRRGEGDQEAEDGTSRRSKSSVFTGRGENAVSALSILHLSTADNLGGSARSAYKIHAGLRSLGHASRMLVRSKTTSDPDVDLISKGAWRRLDHVGRHLLDPCGMQGLFFPSSFSLARHPWVKAADVIQLYNIHGGYFSHLALRLLARGRGVVWRLSDMWPITGHCSYSHGCERWASGCGACPKLDEYPALPFDNSAFLWKIKRLSYPRRSLRIVATNSWMAEIASRSPLFQGCPVTIIPNGVDTDVFRPHPKTEARRLLGLPESADIVLFCAHSATAGTRKGGEFVNPAVEALASRGRETTLAVLGQGSEAWPDAAGARVVRLGYAQSDALLAAVYAAADALICPARAENLPNTMLEAMACGVPSVAFDNGGVRDAVRRMETGYLAAPGDGEDLVRGLCALLDPPGGREAMARRCRDIAVREYDVKRQTDRFVRLYRTLADEGRD